MRSKLLATVALTALATLSNSFAQDIVQEGHYLFDNNKQLIKAIQSQGDLTIDHVGKYGYEVYGPTGVGQWLNELAQEHSIKVIDLNDEANEKAMKKAFANYPSAAQTNDRLEELAAKYPEIIKVINIGASSDGQDLLFVKMSDNVEQDELEPEFKYIANMHGDEIVGRELMVQLIQEMAEKYTQGDAEITSLINSTEIFIMPSMNPAGADGRHRGNNNYADLNRNFPDFTADNNNNPNGREVETKAIMAFQAEHQFALSANFHGGSEVVNYPWDTTADEFPLEDLIKNISLEYAKDVPGMRDSREFQGGVTNGYDWYEVDGGMQDWSYHWYNDLQVTIELSNTKWPNFSTIPSYYKNNHDSMIRFIERIHQGAGFKLSSNRAGRVEIEKSGFFKSKSLGEFAFSGGEFYKVLEPGRYHFTVNDNQGSEQSFDVKVTTQNGSFTPNYVLLD